MLHAQTHNSHLLRETIGFVIRYVILKFVSLSIKINTLYKRKQLVVLILVLHSHIILFVYNFTSWYNSMQCKSSERLFRMYNCHKENRIAHVIENNIYSHKKLHNLGQCRRLGRIFKYSQNDSFSECKLNDKAYVV